jgi:hypothetical protein
MVWRVRADCTYTTSANKTTRQNAAQAVLDAHSVEPVAGRFSPGITSLSSTRFTLSVDVADLAELQSLIASLTPALTSSVRSQTYFSYHNAGDE